MNGDSHGQRQSIQKMRMNGWAYASVVILLVAGMFASGLFATGLLLAFKRPGTQHLKASTSFVIRSPTFIAGPAIEMSLPAGSNLASASVDADGGNWWYQGTSNENLQLLIAASRIRAGQPAISDSYLQRVIRIVERSGGDQVTAMGPVEAATTGSYSGRRAAFDVTRADGTQERAAAFLIRRESDDLLIVLFGEQAMRPEVDRAAQEVFDSLHPRPTPQQYDVHSAVSSPFDLSASSAIYVLRCFRMA